MKLKNLFIGLVFAASALLTQNAFATDYYFSSSTGSNSNPCTQALPCHDFKGTTLDNLNALSGVDNVYFKRGDSWSGTEAEVVIRSSGTSGDRLIIADYGTGNKPIFYMGPVVTAFTLHSGNVWKATVGSQSTYAITQGDDLALSWYQVWDNRIGGNNNANDLREGTFCRSSDGVTCNTWQGGGTTVFVRLWGNANPNTSQVRLPTYTPDSGLGQGGVIRTYQGSNIGNYVTFKNLKVVGSNKVGFSAGATSVYFEDCEIVGAGMDGVLFNSNIGTGEHNCDGCRWYGTVNPILAGESAATSIISYSAASGAGNGQGFTTYAPRSWIYNTVIRNNFMAGADFLDFNSRTNVVESGIFNCIVHDNGRWKDQDLSSPSGANITATGISYDPQIYNDAGKKIIIYGNIAHSSGTQTDATNSRSVIAVSTEHPTSKPAYEIWVVNNLVYNGNWVAFSVSELCYSWEYATECPPAGTKPTNLRDIYFINNTAIARNGNMIWTFGDVDSIVDTFKFYNNVVISDPYVNAYGVITATWFDSEYNNWYRRGFASSTAELWATSNGNTPRYALTAWQSATGEDSSPNSFYGDPLLVNNSATAPDAHLQSTSPARNAALENAWTVPAWVPSDISALMLPCGEEICGTTSSSGTEDENATNLDMGFHYYTGTGTGGATCGDLVCNGAETCSSCPGDCGSCTGVLTSTNVQPATLNANAVGNAVITFTTQNAVPSTGKIEVIFPVTLGSGYILNSGGTTGVVTSSGFDGTLSATVAANKVTITRSGGTSSAAGAKSITISFVQNPNAAGSTGTYSITTKTSADVTIDFDTNVASDIIVAGGPTTVEGVSLEVITIS